MSKNILSFVTIIALLIASACVSSTSVLEKAREKGTVTAYENFLRRFPESKFVPVAKAELASLRARESWQVVQQANTLGAYEEFVKMFPKSSEAELARERIHALTEGKRWAEAKTNESVEGYRKFLVEYPNSRYKGEAEGPPKIVLV